MVGVKGSARDGRGLSLDGGTELVQLLLLLMATNWMVGRKGSARDGRGLSVRG